MVHQSHPEKAAHQLARSMGAFAGFADRHRHMFEGMSQRADLLIGIAFLLHGLVGALAAAVPEFRGRELTAVLERPGPVPVLRRLSTIPMPVLGRQLSTWLIANALTMAIRAKDGEVVADTDYQGQEVFRFLEVAFSPTNRRAARRALERYLAEWGLGRVTVDFAACWRAADTPYVISQLPHGDG